MGKRSIISTETLKPLLAKSGNVCAYPGCNSPIFNEENLYVAHVCHIEAASPEGPRYNPDQSEAERNGYDNLILMCYRHHVETHDETKYTVQNLKEIKDNHESKFIEDPYKFDMDFLFKIQEETGKYWEEVRNIHNNEHITDFYKIHIKHKASFEELCTDLKGLIYSINDDNVFNTRMKWEIKNIKIPNIIKKSNILIVQMEIKYLEEFIKFHRLDLNARRRLKKLKDTFKEYARTAIHND